MIRLGLRLALASGREAVARLIVITVAVALGATLLLATLAGTNAVQAQNSRYAWLSTATVGASGPADPAWWVVRTDYVDGAVLGRVDVAPTGPRSAVPPGVDRLPGPGEFSASPALSALIRSTPADELGDRFPGREVGTIGPAALPGPDSLLVIVGHHPDDLAAMPGARQVTGVVTTDPASCDGCVVGMDASALNVLLAVIALALLFPLTMLIGTATRLAAARREQRFAAMRLIGATPRQVSVLAAVESTVAATLGTVLGFGLFLAVRSALAGITFTDVRFFPADLRLTVIDVAAVVVGIPVVAAVAARLALHRVRITPLGVSRRATPRPPRAWRLIPVSLGVAELVYFVGRRPETTNGQLQAYMTGLALVTVGLVIAGPWLTMLGARITARRANGLATLIAGRRLADNPKAGFRAVSGLMLALFVTSVATGVITTIVANRTSPHAATTATTDTLTRSFSSDGRPDGTPAPGADAVPPRLSTLPGVLGIRVVHEHADPDPGAWLGLVSCDKLPPVTGFGRCAPGATVARVRTDTAEQDPIWPGVDVTPDQLRTLPLASIDVATDGSKAALGRARTVLANAFPNGRFAATTAEFEGSFQRSLVQWQQLADVVILASLPIAGCNLAVSVAGGLADRRRPFSMLRLTGVQLGTLRRVVALETAVPLLTSAAVAVGTGLLAAHLFLTSQMGYSLAIPGPAYWVLVGVGVVVALGIITSTMPLLNRITGSGAARTE
jgi:hypothetical protein